MSTQYFTLEELQEFGKKHFPEALKKVSNTEIYDLVKCKWLDEEQDIEMLRIGKVRYAERYAIYVVNALVPSETEVDLIDTDGEHARPRNIRVGLGIFEEFDKNLTSRLRLQIYYGIQNSVLELSESTKHKGSIMGSMDIPFRPLWNNTRATNNRARGLNSFSLFVEYVFMLKGKSDGLGILKGKDSLYPFKGACENAAKEILVVPDRGKKGEKKVDETSSN
jgi:hypothetical protein